MKNLFISVILTICCIFSQMLAIQFREAIEIINWLICIGIVAVFYFAIRFINNLKQE